MNTNENWPSTEELESQQSPFDPQGSYPFDYKIVIVEQVAEDTFQEQLRTYTIKGQLDETKLEIPDEFSKEMGRRFRFAKEGEAADLHVINQETSDPIGLVIVQENS